MYEKTQASGLTEFIPSVCTSAVWGPQLYGDLSCMGASAVWGPQLYGDLSYMGASAVWGPQLYADGPSPCSSCFLHSPSSSAITVGGGGSTPWIAVWGALIHIWRAEITDGCDIFCLLIWQEIFSFHTPKLSR